MKLIDKAALVAEIERRMKRYATVSKESGVQYRIKYHTLMSILSFLDTLEVKEVEEEPVSNDLEEAATKYARKQLSNPDYPTYNDEYEMECAFEAGAQWQKEQMEKNRIEHCDNITEEQYNLETGFLDGFLDKNKRMPTFLDAIEYGMKKVKKDEGNT